MLLNSGKYRPRLQEKDRIQERMAWKISASVTGKRHITRKNGLEVQCQFTLTGQFKTLIMQETLSRKGVDVVKDKNRYDKIILMFLF